MVLQGQKKKRKNQDWDGLDQPKQHLGKSHSIPFSHRGKSRFFGIIPGFPGSLESIFPWFFLGSCTGGSPRCWGWTTRPWCWACSSGRCECSSRIPGISWNSLRQKCTQRDCPDPKKTWNSAWILRSGFRELREIGMEFFFPKFQRQGGAVPSTTFHVGRGLKAPPRFFFGIRSNFSLECCKSARGFGLFSTSNLEFDPFF